MRIWLFKPFERIAGGRALGVGIGVIVLTALVAFLSNLQTDGVLDLHFAAPLPFWQLILQGMVNWLVLAVLLLGMGRWLSSTRFRALDLFGTQAMARWPMLLAAGYLSIPAIGDQMRALSARMMENMPSDPGQVTADMVHMIDAMWLTLISLPLLFMLGWMIWLMFHGYALVCNLNGTRAFFSFVGALIAAEILTKAFSFLF